MGVISHTQVRKGIKLLIDGEAYEVIDVDHVKPGKGSAFARARVKNLRTGQVLEKTYKAGDKVETADTQERKMLFLYRDGDGFHFMDQNTYEQILVSEETIGEASLYLAENTEVSMVFHENTPIGIDLPNFVILEIVDTEPGFKGDTVSGGKPAKCNTGAVVVVPFHLNVGDKIVVDTRTGEYREKA